MLNFLKFIVGFPILIIGLIILPDKFLEEFFNRMKNI